jgi:hypothetical protein
MAEGVLFKELGGTLELVMEEGQGGGAPGGGRDKSWIIHELNKDLGGRSLSKAVLSARGRK